MTRSWLVVGRNPAYRAAPRFDAAVLGRLGSQAVIVGVRVAGDGEYGWIQVSFWRQRSAVYVWAGLVIPCDQHIFE